MKWKLANVKVLIIKALNANRTHRMAAKDLGISKRNLVILKYKYNIYYNESRKCFEACVNKKIYGGKQDNRAAA